MRAIDGLGVRFHQLKAKVRVRVKVKAGDADVGVATIAGEVGEEEVVVVEVDKHNSWRTSCIELHQCHMRLSEV
jgi:hypothetical protein